MRDILGFHGGEDASRGLLGCDAVFRVISYRNTIWGHNPGDLYFNTNVQGRIRKIPDWPPGARTANGTALCH
jgi:hypothetical protein